jgi:hypothetical protein
MLCLPGKSKPKHVSVLAALDVSLCVLTKNALPLISGGGRRQRLSLLLSIGIIAIFWFSLLRLRAFSLA